MATIHSSPHFVIFPFMSQGHTIPLLYLARLLHQRSVNVTVFTTPANSLAIRGSLHDLQDISIIELPFPNHTKSKSPSVQITNSLPSMSSFLQFAISTKLIQPHFENALHNLMPISCIISDGFLTWTQESASRFGIPRFVFYGTNNFSMTMYNIISKEKPHAGVSSNDEPFTVPNFQRLKLTVNDLEPPFTELEPEGEYYDFLVEQQIAMSKSQGLIVNSFYELEPSFTDYWNKNFGPRAWCVGPLCLAKPPKSQKLQKPTWVKWLDSKLAMQEPVLYVAFGTQAEIPVDQLSEIAIGLEKSKVNFLWVIRKKGFEYFLKGFEEKVKNRGMIVNGWVDQMEILKHKSVFGFLSHCGWNSVLEGICAKVPILALPFMAEQHLNARMVVEEISIGLRIWSSSRSARGFVKSEEVEKMVRELMEGERGKMVRKKVNAVGEAARRAVNEGGSSWCTLDLLTEKICGKDVDSSFFPVNLDGLI